MNSHSQIEVITQDQLDAINESRSLDISEFIQFFMKNKELCLSTFYSNEQRQWTYSLMSACLSNHDHVKIAFLLDNGWELDVKNQAGMFEVLLNPKLRWREGKSLPAILLDKYLERGYDFSSYAENLTSSQLRDDILGLFEVSDSVGDVFQYIDKVIDLDACVERISECCVYRAIIKGLAYYESRDDHLERLGWGVSGQRTNEVINVFFERGYPVRRSTDDSLAHTVVQHSVPDVIRNLIDKNLLDISDRKVIYRDLLYRDYQYWRSTPLNENTYRLILPKVLIEDSEYAFKAMNSNTPKFAEYLVIAGVNPDACFEGKPLIHHAFDKGYKSVVAVLADRIENMNYEMKDGVTIYDVLSTTAGYKKFAARLKKRGAKSAEDLVDKDNVNYEDLIGGLLVFNSEPWQIPFRECLSNLELPKQEALYQLVKLSSSTSSAQPSKKFLKEFNSWVDVLGKDNYQSMMARILPKILETTTVGDIELTDYPEAFTFMFRYYDKEDAIKGDIRYALANKNTQILKGLIWGCSDFNDASLSRSLRLVAKGMYSKVPGIGPRNSILGNASTIVLCDMPDDSGLKEVAILKASFKYPRALKSIDSVLNKAAKKKGITLQELEDKMVSDYEMESVGLLEKGFDQNYQGRFQIINGTKGVTEYTNLSNNKITKSVPAELNRQHKEAVKDFKGTIKDIQKALSAHSARIESLYLSAHKLTVPELEKKYINHTLIGVLGRNLIWEFTVNDSSVSGIFLEGKWVNSEGNKIEIADSSEVTLWHPINHNVEEVTEWRDFIIKHQITQPFKQAFREVYALTDAEKETHDHSLRFSNHIILHDIFHALAEQRRWTQTKGGSWDGGSDNDAHRHLSAYGINVLFEAQGLEQYDFTDGGMYRACGTGMVRFTKDGERLALSDIDPIVFSECMRDVDLFVGVCSVALDDSWREAANEYWNDYGLGQLNQSAKARYDVIERLLPMIKDGAKMHLSDKFLVVKGSYRIYKIHLGSSNILMEPNDMYLCIVPKPQAGVLLPFEGDKTLGLILSKAIMLSNDTKIKDETIISQIEQNS